MNGHINNAVYLAWALESVPQDIYDNYTLFEVRFTAMFELSQIPSLTLGLIVPPLSTWDDADVLVRKTLLSPSEAAPS